MVDFDLMNAIKIIGAQIIYLIIVLLVANLIYRKGVKKLNVKDYNTGTGR